MKKHPLLCRIILFSLLVAIIATLFTLLMCGKLGSVVPLASFLDREIAEEKPYSTYHLIAIACLLVITFILLKFCSRFSDNKYRLVIFMTWLILVILELLKQFSNYYYFYNGELIINYIWNAFPFQFCSSPLYIYPFIFLLNDGKIRKACEMFSIVFIVFGGLVNYIYPSTVLGYNIFSNIQTLVHHGMMIAISIYIAYYRRNNLNLKDFLPSLIVFMVMISIAVILNETIYHLVPRVHSKQETFNMFYISAYFESAILIIRLAQPYIPNFLFIILYCAGFIGISYIILIIYSLAINHKIKPCLPNKLLKLKS